MTAVVRVSRMLYSALIRLYPYRFRAEFANEMEMVFADLLTEAAQVGIGSVIALLLRELRDLPINLIREHWLSNQKEEQMNGIKRQFTMVRTVVLITVFLTTAVSGGIQAKSLNSQHIKVVKEKVNQDSNQYIIVKCKEVKVLILLMVNLINLD